MWSPGQHDDNKVITRKENWCLKLAECSCPSFFALQIVIVFRELINRLWGGPCSGAEGLFCSWSRIIAFCCMSSHLSLSPSLSLSLFLSLSLPTTIPVSPQCELKYLWQKKKRILKECILSTDWTKVPHYLLLFIKARFLSKSLQMAQIVSFVSFL